MTQIEWINRKFNFDFPEGLFPVIISRLKGAYPRIVDLTQNCSDQILSHQINNKWSIKQQIGHLSDLEELHTARINDFKNNAKILSAWDGTNKKTFEADHNNKSIKILLEEFKSVRDHFIQELLTFSASELIKTSLHPRLQKQMRIVDMAFFVAEHDDHHIAKMWEIIVWNKNQI